MMSRSSLVVALLALVLVVVQVHALDFSGQNFDDMADHATGEAVLREAAKVLQATLSTYNLNLVTAESLTGGKIISTVVDVSPYGANKYGGFATYDSDAKRRFLGVQTPNVYSESCARQMARGALLRSRATVAIAVTGHSSLMALDTPSLGHVDMAISFRTTSTGREVIEKVIGSISDLYQGVPVESSPVQKARLNWGLKEYKLVHELADSGNFATYHVHFSFCDVDHGFPGTALACDTVAKNMVAKKKDYTLVAKVKDVIRRSVVYAALHLAHEVIDGVFKVKDMDKELDVLPAGARDNDQSRRDCQEPTDVVNAHLKTKITKVAAAKCNTHEWVAPADIPDAPAFLEEEEQHETLRHNH